MLGCSCSRVPFGEFSADTLQKWERHIKSSSVLAMRTTCHQVCKISTWAMVTTAYVSRSITIFRKYWFMWIHPIRYVMRQLYQRPQSVIPFVRNNNSGRLELRLPCGQYTLRGLHEYPIAVASTVHSDSRIITGHSTVTIHIWEGCNVVGTKFLPIAVFPPYGECSSTKELPGTKHQPLHHFVLQSFYYKLRS